MDRVRRQVEAARVWGQEGNPKMPPVTVGVLDTGVAGHPDLEGRILAFRDFVGNGGNMYDDNGHGTHICGILCGSGRMSSGKYRGMAPESVLAVGKVLDRNGDGATRHMIDGLNWILESRVRLKIRILNISVGIGEISDRRKEEALKAKIEEVWDEGIAVVCAAGNKGPGDGSISVVGGSRKVITVGCCDGAFVRKGVLSCETYSGRGKSADRTPKPDVVAPGTAIYSCSHQYGNLPMGFSEGAYVAKSGTSMATAIVSGAIALLLQKFPDMTNEDVKRRLTYTATDLGKPWNLQGWGMVNVKKLLKRY